MPGGDVIACLHAPKIAREEFVDKAKPDGSRLRFLYLLVKTERIGGVCWLCVVSRCKSLFKMTSWWWDCPINEVLLGIC